MKLKYFLVGFAILTSTGALAWWLHSQQARETQVSRALHLLSLPVHEGKTFHPVYVAGLPYRQMLIDQKFEQLDQAARALLASREMLSSGYFGLEALQAGVAMCGFSNCPDEEASDVEWEIVRTRLDQWVTTGSVLAQIMRADFELNVAWRARGHARAHRVPSENFRTFHHHVAIAEEMLASVPESGAEFPTYAATYINLAKVGTRWSKADAIAEFESALSEFHWYTDLYPSRGPLSDVRWGGEDGEFEVFVEETIGHLQGNPLAEIMFARLHWANQTFRERKQLQAQWPRMSESFRSLLSQFPHDWNTNTFAYASCYAGHIDPLHESLLQVKEVYQVLWRGNFDKCLQATLKYRYDADVVEEARKRLAANAGD